MNDPSAAITRATLATGVSDFLWACVLSMAVYGSTFARLWQGVASVPFGARAIDGGPGWVAVGIVMHFVVALAWSTMLVALVRFVPAVQLAMHSTAGAVGVALVYGPLIRVAMSLVVVPALAHRAVPVNMRWWIQLAGHFCFVGLPMVLAARSILVTAPTK